MSANERWLRSQANFYAMGGGARELGAAVTMHAYAAAANEIRDQRQLLQDCAEHFKRLREAGVFVWPNHPLNPEARIAELLKRTT